MLAFLRIRRERRRNRKITKGTGLPCLIHQPSNNMLNGWIEADLLDTLEKEGIGCIAFTPLAQGLLTSKYLHGVPDVARIKRAGGGSLKESHLSEENLTRIRALNEIANARGQSLAQMALAWVLRDPRVPPRSSERAGPSKFAKTSLPSRRWNFLRRDSPLSTPTRRKAASTFGNAHRETCLLSWSNKISF